MLRIEVLANSDWADRLRSSWDDLADSMAFSTPFHRLEWLETWCSQIGRRNRPCVVTIWEGRDLVGALPLLRRPGLLKVLSSMGAGPSDYLHHLVRAGAEKPVSDALSGWVAEEKDVTLDLHQIREGCEPAFLENAAPPRRQAACLVLELPTNFDAYRRDLSKSLRYDAGRLDSDAYRAKSARVVEAGNENWEACLDAFFELHQARWRKRGLPGAFLGRLARFHRAWAPKAIKRGWLWLRILELDGRPTGAIYAMRSADTCFFYQAGMDPEYRSFSPGTVLVAETIRRSIDEGLCRFDFMRGDEPYKRRWKPQHAFVNHRWIRPADGLSGTIVVKRMSIQASVEDRLRERFEGRSLIPNKPRPANRPKPTDNPQGDR